MERSPMGASIIEEPRQCRRDSTNVMVGASIIMVVEAGLLILFFKIIMTLWQLITYIYLTHAAGIISLVFLVVGIKTKTGVLLLVHIVYLILQIVGIIIRVGIVIFVFFIAGPSILADDSGNLNVPAAAKGNIFPLICLVLLALSLFFSIWQMYYVMRCLNFFNGLTYREQPPAYSIRSSEFHVLYFRGRGAQEE